jgi:hypothetical protein
MKVPLLGAFALAGNLTVFLIYGAGLERPRRISGAIVVMKKGEWGTANGE